MDQRPSDCSKSIGKLPFRCKDEGCKYELSWVAPDPEDAQAVLVSVLNFFKC